MQKIPRRRKARRYRSDAVSDIIERLENRLLFTAYYVNSSADDGGNGNLSTPWNTLSSVSSYNGFHPGDVVNLTGTFKNQTLTLGATAEGITVTSSASDPAQIVESTNYYFTGAITVTTSNVTISNLQLTGPGIDANSNSFYAIYLNNTGSTQLTGDTINHINETGFVFAGAQITSASNGFTNLSITNSNFSNNQVSGINVEGSGTAYVNYNLLISYCTTSNNAGDAIYWNANHAGSNEDSQCSGIELGGVVGGVVTHCTAIGNCYDATGAAGIWAHDSTNLDFEYCESADTGTAILGYDGEGFDFDHGVSDSIMQYDYSHGNYGPGLLICAYGGNVPCEGDTIRYCVSNDDALYGGSAIEAYGYSTDYMPHSVLGANIYNNTVLVSSYSAADIGIIGLTPAACSYCTINIFNNIFYNGTTYSAQSALVDCSMYTPQLSNVIFEGNDYYSNVLPSKFRVLWGTTSYFTLSQWSAATGEESLNGTLVGLSVDPQLINETVGDLPISDVPNLRLSLNSALRDAAVNLSAPPFTNTLPFTNYAPYDIDGTAWNGTGGQDYFGDPVLNGSSQAIGFDQPTDQPSTLIINGSPDGDTFNLCADPTQPDTLDVNNSTYSLKGIDSVIIEGSTGNESVTYDFKNGPLTNTLGTLSQYGVTFIGGSASNTLTTIDTGTVGTGSMPIFFDPAASASNSVDASYGTITIPTGTQTGITTTTFSSVTIAAGAEVDIATTTGGQSNRTFVVISDSLNLAGKTNAWTGTLDLGGNDLDLKNGNLTTLTNQIQQGSNESWQASGGIISSAAAQDTTHLTTLGVILNTPSGTQPGPALYNTFDSNPVLSTDVLVKYTYFGDTNLDGVIDGSDYTRIDNGYLAHLTGWANGDFNYDNTVSAADYALIDNAFNSHDTSLTAQIAPSMAPKSSLPPVAGVVSNTGEQDKQDKDLKLSLMQTAEGCWAKLGR